jgi:ubiquinone/menaquinone biosynthesis C-methylase UbiE
VSKENALQQGNGVMTAAHYTGGAVGYDRMFGHVTCTFLPLLLEAAQISPGHRVLDVATGTGAAARAAEKVVGPTGEVVAGDVSVAMLDVARRHPETAAITFRPFDGHSLPFPDERFDRIICQFGLAFFEAPDRALSEFRRVLVPDGRTAVVVNSRPERSLFTRIGTVIGQHVTAKSELLNRYASIGTTERLRSLIEEAGFADVEARSATRSFSFASFDDYFSGTEAGAGISGQEFVKLAPDLRRAVREEVQRSFLDEGMRRPLVVEMEVLVGSGRRHSQLGSGTTPGMSGCSS